MDVPEGRRPSLEHDDPPAASRRTSSILNPLSAVRDAMRRISSTERFPAASPARLIQNSNYGNLSEVPTNGGSGDAGMVTVDLNAPSTSRRVSRVRKSTAISPDQIRLEISQRAEELRTQGLSNPAFAEEEYDQDGQLADRMAPLPHFPSRDGAVAWRSQKISVGYDPRDVTPSAINYDDDGIRPTLDDLRRDLAAHGEDSVRQTGNERKLKRGTLGWIRGVWLWSVLNLWGVMLFLRIAWMNAQAGMGLFLVIVLMGTVIAVLTSLSTSAISTNGEVGLGGTYYMISRSLGPQFGAAIGVIFSIANAISVSLNIQGFADTVQGLLEDAHLSPFTTSALNDIRVISVVTLVLLTGFTFFGMEIASRLQLLFFTILMASIFNIVIGSIIPPNEEAQAKGFVGYSNALFRENFKPAFQDDANGRNSFMSVFGVFFPSVTGILAGTSITGDLKDPSGAIPKGTMTAIFFTSVSYIVIGWTTASVTLRHASGSVADLRAGNLTACHHDPYWAHDLSTLPDVCGKPDSPADCPCSYGSINFMEIMEIVGHFRPIILAGIFSATLSTALGCINFAPKIFQALCRDKIFPFIHIFGHGYTKNDEPYRAYALVMIIAVIFLMPSDLNFISNIVSNCFLMTYTLVNYATFDASYSNAPGWRPTFKYYNKWLSLATALACFVIMFALDWKSAVIVVGISVVLWLYVYYKNPNVNWGTSAQANTYKSALNDMHRLQRIEDHVKNYRPQVLVLTGLPCVRPALVYFANSITHGTGLLICGHVLVGESVKQRSVMASESYKWLRRRKLRAFYDYVAANSTAEGIRALIQTSGLGKLKPNILMMGFHRSWYNWSEVAMEEYTSALNEALDAKMGIALLYAKEGFDITTVVNFEKLVEDNTHEGNDQLKSAASADHVVPLELKPIEDPEVQARVRLAELFETGKKKHIVGEIHVWWLYDDGGLTLLIPHLLNRQSPWDKCKLKIFILAGQDPVAAKKEMLSLLEKFRIKADEVIPVDMEQPPGREQTQWFDRLIGGLREDGPTRNRKVSGLGVIRESEVREFGERTSKQIRLRELLLEHSSKSALTVVTMPLPKTNQSAIFYMASLHALTSDMPATLLIRGTQENVLTYYC